MKPMPLLASILVITGLLTSPPMAAAQEIDFRTGGFDATCHYHYVGAWAQIYKDGSFVPGVVVTFTLGGEVKEIITDHWGWAEASFPYDLGSGELTIEIDAGGYGSAAVAVSGPAPDDCDIVGFGWWDAACLYPLVGGYVYLIEDGQPVEGVPVTFTLGGDVREMSTDEWGNAWAEWPYTFGSGAHTLVIDAGGYGSQVFTVSGPDSCAGSLTIACDGMSLVFSAPDGLFGMDFRVEYADGEFEYVHLGELLPSYTYHFEKPIVRAWAWVYDSSGSPEGWIEATPGACPVSEAVPLVMMYVYYSPSGFFGGPGPSATNTMTIYSAQGAPTASRLEYWAGGKLPGDWRLACSAMLYDDGAGGLFACDSFLDSVGERRALLRNDPEGRDLLDPILRYLSWAGAKP